MEKFILENSVDQGSHLLQTSPLEVKSLKTAATFLSEIESIKNETNMSYMDCVIHYCEQNGTEIETAGSLIKNIAVLKAKIQDEAELLNFLPKTAKLPLLDE